ncbi:MAG: adenylate/guanylate cyclase domain-containing protein [Novosphingobium sp.]|nr:adenylate/guanylate cyclase domain-containing protein [Novosphingobium sp.]MCP5401876.1 adenylate/guanylate cyclase domain-containing protein [Novosphingobium sp.]
MTAGTARGAALRGLLGRGWRNVRAAGPRRLAATLALLAIALIVARLSWQLPVVGDAERALYDLRAFVSAPRVEQDQRIQIVIYDDQTLIAARKRSPLDRGLLAQALANIDAMGAKAIGVDILFDQPQDEDEELLSVLRGMKTPTFVAYADTAETGEHIKYEQEQFLDDFVERLEGSNARAGSIRLDYAHGVARSWPEHPENLPPLMSRAMIALGDPGMEAGFAGHDGALRFRLPAEEGAPVYSELRIDLFADPELAAVVGGQLRGKYVLIGGNIVDFDRKETPFTAITGQTVPGINVHATMLAQMLDGAKLPRFAGWQLWAIAALVVLAAAVTSLAEAKILKVLPFLAIELLAIAGIPFLAQARGMDTLGMPAAGLALGWIVAFMAVSSAARASGAVERRFAQSALGKYLPKDIAQEIIDYPERLALRGSKKKLFILFSDLEGFTKLSSQLEPEAIATLLNDYLDRLSQVVLDHGGVIDKYVGDAVVAFWGAPIAREDDALKAAQAGYALWQAGEEFRRSVGPGLPPVGKTRVGLHYGEAVVGNFGGEGRIQYTALGDAMNTAARLESANKALCSSVMASREFAEQSGLDWWRQMGRVVLRGRAQPVDLFEPAPDFPESDREDLARAMTLLDGERERAIAIVEALAAKHASDEALQNLLMRIRNLGENDAYVLG